MLAERALLLAGAGRGGEAADLLRRALAESPDEACLMSALASVLLSIDETKEALRWARRAFALTGLVDDGIILTDALYRRFRPRKAVQLARELVAAAPDYPPALTQLAMSLIYSVTFSRKAFREALAAAGRAAELAPDDPDPQIALAAVHWADDSWSRRHRPARRAAEILGAVLAKDPANAAAHVLMIEVQETLGQHSAALATGMTAAQQAPGLGVVAALPMRPVLGMVRQAVAVWMWGCLLIVHYGLKYGGWSGLLALPVLAVVVSSILYWVRSERVAGPDWTVWRRAVRLFKAGDYLFWWRPWVLAPVPFAVLLAVQGELGWLAAVGAAVLVGLWAWPTEARGRRWTTTRSSLTGYALGSRVDDPGFPLVRGLVARAGWAACLTASAAVLAAGTTSFAAWLVMAGLGVVPLVVGFVAPAVYLRPAWRARESSLFADMGRRDPRLLVTGLVIGSVAAVSALSWGVPALRPLLFNAALVAAGAGTWARWTVREGRAVAAADIS